MQVTYFHSLVISMWKDEEKIVTLGHTVGASIPWLLQVGNIYETNDEMRTQGEEGKRRRIDVKLSVEKYDVDWDEISDKIKRFFQEMNRIMTR